MEKRALAKLHFYYSAMNAGKSALLLQAAHNYEERGMSVILYTASVDDRFEKKTIHSRIGLTHKANVFDENTFFFDEITHFARHMDVRCVLVDEAQFLTKEQVFNLAQVVDELKIPVLCYGIRTDFRAEPFQGSQYLLAIADQLIELKTICHCGKKATMNMRVDSIGKKITEGNQLLIGGNNQYIATCRAHYIQGNSGVTRNPCQEEYYSY